MANESCVRLVPDFSPYVKPAIARNANVRQIVAGNMYLNSLFMIQAIRLANVRKIIEFMYKELK